MRFATLMTMLAVTLALAACDSNQDATETDDGTMAEATPAEDMPMADQTPRAAAGETGQMAGGEGTVTEIDAEAGTITIDHGAIEAVDWPAMTMVFQADEAQRQRVAVGDRVGFEFRTTESGGEITSINRK